ncbi:MAG TPA: TIGR04283 family arsenosugar biosynthesis glycosyltransferase [Candidatus Binatia bacterium]|nr:TIGR04283 family arsenosugar biosynthesis glycosyltransferase [Candidatus Binatia bacterium]
MDISIVIPVLNEAGSLPAALPRARAAQVRELIVVDGGSVDDTVAVARRYTEFILVGPRGRATQMNAGAAQATGEVLLFLHADTWLPAGFDAAVANALTDPRVVGGRFDVRLEPSSRLLRVVAALMNLRSRLSRIATGDQAIFVRRQTFERIGGFAEMPLMEDIAFTRALKRAGRIACLRECVTTSSRRWQRNGVLRTILLMWMLRLLYFCGVSPSRLRAMYTDTR